MRSQVLLDLPVEPARERTPPPPCTPCTQHRWTAYAPDGIATCNACGEERGQLRVVDDDTHFTPRGPLKKGKGNCRHVWAAADEEQVSVCSMCGLEEGGSDG